MSEDNLSFLLFVTPVLVLGLCMIISEFSTKMKNFLEYDILDIPDFILDGIIDIFINIKDSIQEKQRKRLAYQKAMRESFRGGKTVKIEVSYSK